MFVQKQGLSWPYHVYVMLNAICAILLMFCLNSNITDDVLSEQVLAYSRCTVCIHLGSLLQYNAEIHVLVIGATFGISCSKSSIKNEILTKVTKLYSCWSQTRL